MVGETVGHYRILEKLGEGGMGVVYKAEDLKLKREVALKFLPPELTRDPEARNRFVREAQAASALDHPNIGVVHEIDETGDGRFFICMVLYDGGTLKQKMECGPLDAQDVVRTGVQVAEGLKRAHEAGIIHRDIKPANVLATRDGILKIIDFGLAKLAGGASEATKHSRAGTAAYMSPEQIQDGPVDARSDLFSLGVVLYEMATGKKPFTGEHEAALFYSIVYNEPTAPRRLRPEIPEALSEIIVRLLQKDPEERYQNAGEVEDALLASGSEIEAPRLGLLASALHRLVRHRYAAAAAAILSAIALLGVILVTRIPVASFKVEPASYVIVSDFENATKNDVFDHSLSEAMNVSLRQSAHFNIYPPAMVAGTLRRMETPTGAPLTEDLATAVARRDGIGVVVAGSIHPIGAGFLLSCRIIDVNSGETVRVFRREVGRIEGVLHAMDGLCKDIREGLGESKGRLSENTVQLERVTTPSLEALELYSRGNVLEGEGKYRQAAILKSQAFEKDTMFAIAASDLSYIYRKLGDDSLALYYHRRVLPLIDRVTDRERYYILAIYYGPSFEMDFRKAFDNVQQLVVRYPNSSEGYATLGHLAMFVGDYNAALEADRKALSIDSLYKGTVFDNMGYALALSGNPIAALEYFRCSKLIRQQYHSIDGYIAGCYWMAGKLDSAEQVLTHLLSLEDPRTKLLAYFQLSSLYYFEGRLESARSRCSDAIVQAHAQKRAGGESYFHYMMGEIAYDQGNRKTYLNETRRAEEMSESPYPELPLVAASYAEHGYRANAERVLKRIENLKCRDPYFVRRRPDYLHFVRGQILLERGLNVKAKKEFKLVERLHSADPFYLLAQKGAALAAVALHDTNGVRELDRILTQRGEVVFSIILALRNSGPWIRALWPGIDLELAKVSLSRNDTSLAIRHLKNCIRCWQNADPDFSGSKEVHRLLSKSSRL